MRYLGIDVGTKKVGLALSDEAGTMGFPHGVIPYDDELIPTLRALIEKERVGAVVIGESLDASGKGNPIEESAKKLGEALSSAGIPVHYELEAFTTQEARRDLEGNRTYDTLVDASAAALILTSYLSHAHDNHR